MAAVVSVIAVVGIFVCAIVKGLTPRKLSEEDPHEVFEEFVCKPTPASVRILEVSGGIAFAGGGVYIRFEIDRSDLDALIQRGTFKEARESDRKTIGEWRPEGYGEEWLHYERGRGYGEDHDLFVAPGGQRCWYTASYN